MLGVEIKGYAWTMKVNVEVLRQVMKHTGMSHRELARRASEHLDGRSLTSGAISHLVAPNPRRHNVRPEVAVAIAAVFRMPVSYLFLPAATSASTIYPSHREANQEVVQ